LLNTWSLLAAAVQQADILVQQLQMVRVVLVGF
jgi:hypothetical protein